MTYNPKFSPAVEVPDATRTCPRCGREFNAYGRQRVCLPCRAPRVTKVERSTPGTALSTRERQLVDRIEKGLSNKQIAWELKLSVGTIKEYIFYIARKLKLENRTQIAVWSFAQRHGITTTAD